jgi:hypothetical protein
MLPNQSPESVEKLLNPADPQDVPRAIELIRAVGDLRSLNKSGFNPSQMKTIEALQLIGTLFHAMIEPFVNSNLSLTAQLEYLAQYAHLAFMLYRHNGRAFMSNQLYADSQVMVKNTFFYLAKQRLLNPNLRVLLMLCGDDRLENLFGRVRMQGAHNCHVDIKTLMERLAAAMDLCRLFTVHPSWDQGHRRLNYSRLEHCDHLKPSAWKGELMASSCNPEAAWFAGRACAEQVLHAYHVSADFTEAFSHENVDMLRPFPDGIYPGICTDSDPSVPNVPESTSMMQHEPIEDDGDEEYEDELDDEIDIGMDDILEEPPASDELQNEAGDDWIEHEGHKYHKASLLRMIFSSDFVRKSKERLERVRAFTVDFHKKSTKDSDEALLGVSLFVLGDLFITLVRTGQNIALAVLQATGIEHKSRKVAAVSAAELSLETADIKIAGQVLHLVPHSPNLISAQSSYSISPNCSPPTPESSSDIMHNITNSTTAISSNPLLSAPATAEQLSVAVRESSQSFLWIGDYIKFNAIKAKKDKGNKTATSAGEKISRNALILNAPSYVIEPISGVLVGAKDLSAATGRDLSLRGLTETWQFDGTFLTGVAALLWDKISAKKWKVVETGISYNDIFPYRSQDGMLSSRLPVPFFHGTPWVQID